MPVWRVIECRKLGFTGTVSNIVFLLKHYGYDVTSPGDAFHHIGDNMTDPRAYVSYMGCSINCTIGDIILVSLFLFFFYWFYDCSADVVVWHHDDDDAGTPPDCEDGDDQ